MIPEGALGWLDLGEVVLGAGLAAAGVALHRYRRSLRTIRSGDEARFQGLVEAAPFGVVVHAGGEILYVSRHGRRLLGLDDRAVPDGAVLGGLLDPCAPAQAGTPRQLRLEAAGGRAFEASALTIESSFGGRPACLTFFRDVTAESSARRELAESRERLAVALEAARDGVWELDLGSGRLEATAAFAAIAAPGAAPPVDEASWLALVHPADRDRLRAARATQAAPSAPGYECEVRLARPDGSSAWVLEHGRAAARDAAGRPLRLAGTLRDITARKRAERRLEVRGQMAATFLATRGDELRQRLGALLQEVLEAPCSCIGTSEAGGGLRLACNCATAGGVPAHSLVTPEALPAALRRVLAEAGPVTLEDTGDEPAMPRAPLLGIRLASGERVLGLVAVAGRAGGYRAEDQAMLAGIAEDLAPLVQSRLEAEAVDAELVQAQKMQALGALAGGIAHDFNNILQAILGFSTLARQDAHDPARLAADLDRVQRATVRGRDLVQRILQFSRPGDPDAPPLDPLPLLEEIAIELRAAHPGRITVVTSFAPDCDHVRASPGDLRQALANLATNGVQAMGGAGTLELSARRWSVPAADARFPSDWHGREVVAFAVRDTGPGIPEAIRTRLFDPFFTTRDVGQGTGLGLSVVHGLVTGLGGRVSIECPPQGGTVATVYLPRVDALGHAAAPAPVEGAPTDRPPGPRGRVLFVDDDPEIRDLATALLSRAGLEVETAPDGMAACERLGPAGDGFDVVVTDQYMPGLTGRELALRVAAMRPGLPVILVSGLDEPADTAVAAGLVFREVVTKPFFGQSLILAVRRALEGGRP